METPQPVSQGVLVYATLKWVSLTLPRRAEYEFQLDDLRSRAGESADFQLLLARYREYAYARMLLQNDISKPNPLHVHSVALLDAYSMARCFTQWKLYISTRHMRKEVMRAFYIRNSISRWFTLARGLRLRNNTFSAAKSHHDSFVAISALQSWRLALSRLLEQKRCGTLRLRPQRACGPLFRLWCRLPYERADTARSRVRADNFARAKLFTFALSNWKKRVVYNIGQREILFERVVARAMPNSGAGPFVSIFVYQTQILFRYHLMRWKRFQKRRRNLNKLGNLLLRIRWVRILSLSFGAWGSLFLSRHRLSVCAHRLRMRSRNRSKWFAWFLWKYAYCRRPNKPESRGIQFSALSDSPFQDLARSLLHRMPKLTRRSIVHEHAVLARRQLIWPIMERAIFSTILKHAVQISLTYWRRVHAETVIVNCIQRIWRGCLVRKFAYPGRSRFLRKYKDFSPTLLLFIRRQKQLKVLNVLKSFHELVRLRWESFIQQKFLSRTTRRLRSYAILNRKCKRRLNTCGFHFDAGMGEKFLRLLQNRCYQSILLGESALYHFTETLRTAYDKLANYSARQCRLKLAIIGSRAKEYTLLIKNMLRNKHAAKFQRHSSKSSTTHLLRRSFSKFCERIYIRSTYYNHQIILMKNYIQQRWTIFRNKVAISVVLKKLSVSFFLDHRVRSFFTKILQFVKEKSQSRAIYRLTSHQRRRFLQRNVFERLIIAKYLYQSKMQSDLRTRVHHRVQSLRSALWTMKHYTDRVQLSYIQNNGTNKSLKKFVGKLKSKKHSLRARYIVVAPALISTSSDMFWSYGHRNYIPSNKIIPDDSSLRKKMLQVVISQLDIVKLRTLKNLLKCSRLRALSRVRMDSARNFERKTRLFALRRLYVYQLHHGRHKQRIRKLLEHHLLNRMFYHYFRLRCVVRFMKIKKSFFAVRRIRVNAGFALRHLRRKAELTQKAERVNDIVRQRKMLRNLYALSRQRTIRSLCRKITLVADRRNSRNLAYSFFNQMKPIVDAKKKLVRIKRCLYLRHYLHFWLERAALEIKIYSLRAKSRRRCIQDCFQKWTTNAMYVKKLSLAYNELRRQTEMKLCEQVLVTWVEKIYATRLSKRHDLVHSTHLLARKKYTFRYWHHRAILREMNLWRSASVFFFYLLDLTHNRKTSRHLAQRCSANYMQRKCFFSFRYLRQMCQLQRHLLSKSNDVQCAVLLAKCRALLGDWYIKHKISTIVRKLIFNNLLASITKVQFMDIRKCTRFTTKFDKMLDLRRMRLCALRGVLRWCNWMTFRREKKKQQQKRMHFAAWKACLAHSHGRRLAFGARIQNIWSRFLSKVCFKAFVENMRMSKVSARMKWYIKKATINMWIFKRANRQKIRHTLAWTSKLFRISELRARWHYWKLLVGPASRFERKLLQELVFNRWYNTSLSLRYSRKAVYRKVIRGWKIVVVNKFRARHDVRRGRHLLLNLITKVLQQRRSLVMQAFNMWHENIGTTIVIRRKSAASIVHNLRKGNSSISFTPLKHQRKNNAENSSHWKVKSSTDYMTHWKGNLLKLKNSQERAERTTERFRLKSIFSSDLSFSLVGRGSALTEKQYLLQVSNASDTFQGNAYNSISGIYNGDHDELDGTGTELLDDCSSDGLALQGS